MLELVAENNAVSEDEEYIKEKDEEEEHTINEYYNSVSKEEDTIGQIDDAIE